MTIEIILPSGQRIRYVPKANIRSGDAALGLAKKYGLPTNPVAKRRQWYLRGPLGEIHPMKVMKNLELLTGESLKLESRT